VVDEKALYVQLCDRAVQHIAGIPDLPDLLSGRSADSAPLRERFAAFCASLGDARSYLRVWERADAYLVQHRELQRPEHSAVYRNFHAADLKEAARALLRDFLDGAEPLVTLRPETVTALRNSLGEAPSRRTPPTAVAVGAVRDEVGAWLQNIYPEFVRRERSRRDDAPRA
jgi:hypothetical protein